MLEVRDLRVNYGSTEAVDGLTFSVGSTETLALLGANGAGKTSTLRALSRLVPSRGVIRFDGADLTSPTPDQVARRGLVHVPEGRHVFGSLTVNDNLLVGASARGGRSPLFSLSDVYDLFPALVPLRRRAGWALSGGEQQMVVIGRALLSAPLLLMLDEPSLGLAPVAVKAVYAALAQVRPQVAMLLVEQNSAYGLPVSDRGIVLRSGRVAVEGSAAELADRSALRAGYLGSAATSGAPGRRPEQLASGDTAKEGASGPHV